MQSPSIGAVVLVPPQVGSQLAAHRQSTSPGRTTSRFGLQVLPEQVCAETIVIYRYLSLFIILMKVCTSSEGEMSNKTEIYLREEGSMRDPDHLEAEGP